MNRKSRPLAQAAKVNKEVSIRSSAVEYLIFVEANT
jgi:hypothetical protein